MLSVKEYTNNLINALYIYKDNNKGFGLYEGKDGCLRLAREYAYGLKDYPKEEVLKILQGSYSTLCVRFYNLKPPINAKEWIQEINKIINKTELNDTDIIGKKVKKTSGKPFKSTYKINTIKGIVEHPVKKEPAYIFEEDDSYVSVKQCEIV